jgi:hypothetical protein
MVFLAAPEGQTSAPPAKPTIGIHRTRKGMNARVSKRAAAFVLLFGMLAVGEFATAADKVKIEVVETTSQIKMVSVVVPASPETTDTHCSTSPIGNEYDCRTTTMPATTATTGYRPTFTFLAKAILPDGSHARIMCGVGADKDCALIAPWAPEKSTYTHGPCDFGPIEGDMTCTNRNLGFFWAKRKKDDLVIYGPKGKLTYHITGSW